MRIDCTPSSSRLCRASTSRIGNIGLTYFGARYYQPQLGRWISPDPLTIHGLGSDLNPYAYVGGRVMSHVDPFGLCTVGATSQNGAATVTTLACPKERQASLEDATARGLDYSMRQTARGGHSRGFRPEPGHENDFIRMPGTRPYESPGLAGWAALAEYNGYGIDQGRELAGLIYTKNGRYYSTPAIDTFANSNHESHPIQAMRLVPEGAMVVGIWHTHGRFYPHGANDADESNVARRQQGKKGDWIFSPVSPQDFGVLGLMIKNGLVPSDAIGMVATSSGHVTLYNAGTRPGSERYFFNPTFYVNWSGIKPNWAGVWYVDQTGVLHGPAGPRR